VCFLFSLFLFPHRFLLELFFTDNGLFFQFTIFLCSSSEFSFRSAAVSLNGNGVTVGCAGVLSTFTFFSVLGQLFLSLFFL
jgi:hypothetical protein